MGKGLATFVCGVKKIRLVGVHVSVVYPGPVCGLGFGLCRQHGPGQEASWLADADRCKAVEGADAAAAPAAG